MKTEDKATPYRLYLVIAALLIVAFSVIVRIVNLQLVEGEKYRLLAKEWSIKSQVIKAKKGNVYSSDGSLLATSIPKYDVRFDAMASTKRDFNEFVSPLSDSLAILLGKPSHEIEQNLRKARIHKNRYKLIARNLRHSDWLRLKKFPLFKLGVYRGGVITEVKMVRERPMGDIAQRVIGYERVNQDQTMQRVGIEGAFHEDLNGVDGRKIVQKIAKNQYKPISDKNSIEPKDGADVVATIDVYIQDIAHHALLKQLQHYNADHGCVVVMETKTGDVKAISNLKRGSEGGYHESYNYAISESHEPGSTFKLLSLMNVLEDKVADTGTVYSTHNGELVIYGRKVRDSKEGGYGEISLARGFELSSNTVIVQAVYDNYKHNPARFVDRLNAIKLNQKLGIPLAGEGMPRIPQPTDSNWSGLSLPWMAYGYGLSMTPLQTLTVYNAIANNGVMVKPQFVKEVRELDEVVKSFDDEIIHPKICSQGTIDKLKAVLENVVKRGTGSKLYSEHFSMAGKTGTAQVNYGQGKDNLYYASSFVGYFPADEPKYSCIVVIHKPDKTTGYYGADVAGPVFLKIAQKIFTESPKKVEVKKLQESFEFLEKNYNAYHVQSMKNNHTIPNLMGMPGMDALALLENLGLKVVLKGVGKVKKQSVQGGQKINKNQEIVLELS